MKGPRRLAFTLLEMVVGICLLSMVVLFLVSLLPSSVGTLKRAEALQGATMYGTELIEDARDNPPGTPVNRTMTLNSTQMKVRRDILPTGGGLVDVKVTVSYAAGAEPLVLTTRVDATPSSSPTSHRGGTPPP